LGLKAVLFDLGGTLTTRDIEDRLVDEHVLKSLVECIISKGCAISEENLMKEYWNNYRTVNDLRERFAIEIPMKVWLGNLTHRLCSRNVADAILKAAEDQLVNARVNSAVPFPETESVLETLGSTYRLGVITNTSSEKVANGVLRHLDLNRFFECVVTSAELGIRKPYPGVFLFALREMGLKAEEAIFVGDSYKHDVVGSLGARMRSCLVGNENAVSGGMLKPDIIVNSLSEISGIIYSVFR